MCSFFSLLICSNKTFFGDNCFPASELWSLGGHNSTALVIFSIKMPGFHCLWTLSVLSSHLKFMIPTQRSKERRVQRSFSSYSLVNVAFPALLDVSICSPSEHISTDTVILVGHLVVFQPQFDHRFSDPSCLSSTPSKPSLSLYICYSYTYLVYR